MRKKPEKTDEQHVEEMLVWARHRAKHFKSLLLLQGWSIVLKYDKDLKYFAQSCHDSSYHSASIELGQKCLTAWKEKNYHECRDTVLHELVHGILEPLYSELRSTMSDANKEPRENTLESVTTHVTAILMEQIKTLPEERPECYV